MEGLGQLAYRRIGNKLAYRKNGGALVYKSEPKLIYVVVAWSPRSFVCNTYNTEHYVGGSYSWRAVAGEVRLESSYIGDGQIQLSFRVREFPAAIGVTLTTYMDCAANEYTDVTFRLMVSQRGISPIMRRVTPPGAPESSKSVTIHVDELGDVTAVD